MHMRICVRYPAQNSSVQFNYNSKKPVSGFLSQGNLNILYCGEKKKCFHAFFVTFLSKSILFHSAHLSIYHFAAAVIQLPNFIYFLKLNLTYLILL